jgi:uncharacterized protein (DUF3084 family)
MADATRFKLPTYTDTQLSDPKFSRLQINDLAAKIQQRDDALGERDKQLVALNGQTAKQKVQLDATKAELVKRDETITASNRQIAELLSANADLKKQLERVTVDRPKIAVDDLMRQFSSSVERLNADARTVGGTAFLVENLKVEIKAGIDVSNGLRLSQLPESAIGVESVSTLSFALKPNPVIRIVDDDAPPKPG